MKRKLILHIGLPKTGTSTLQQTVFPNIHSVRYLGRKDGVLGSDIKDIEEQFGHLFYCPANLLKQSASQLYSLIKKKETILFKDSTVQPLFISSELITGHMFMPIFKYRYGLWPLEPDRVFERLKIFEELSNTELVIALTKREPKEFIHSYYAQQYYIFRNIEELDTLQKYIQYGTNESKGAFLGLLYGKKLEAHILKQFDAEQLRIWQFNEIFNNIEGFISKEFDDENFVHKNDERINARSIDDDTKLGDIRPIWLCRSTLKTALLKSIEEFKLQFLKREKLKVKIKWNKNFDKIIDDYVQTK